MEINDALDFLRTNHKSVLITHKQDGDLQPSPVVHGVDGSGRVVISSREPAFKVHNLRKNPNATLCAFTDNFFGPWVTVDGSAEIVSLPEAMDPLVELYRQIQGEHPDWDDYRAAMVRDKRVIIAITPVASGPDQHR
jgi:PPOX class probable F420-dependent enzyme